MNVIKWLEQWALKRVGRREDEKLIQLEEVHQEILDGRLNCEVVFGGPAAKVFAALAFQWFKDTGGKNFVTCTMFDSRDCTRYELTMQRAGGKTPAGRISELTAELAELRKQVAE